MTHYSNEGEKQAAFMQLKADQPKADRWSVEAQGMDDRVFGIVCTREELPKACGMIADDWMDFSAEQDMDQD